jgi:hypothetical protein
VYPPLIGLNICWTFRSKRKILALAFSDLGFCTTYSGSKCLRKASYLPAVENTEKSAIRRFSHGV